MRLRTRDEDSTATASPARTVRKDRMGAGDHALSRLHPGQYLGVDVAAQAQGHGTRRDHASGDVQTPDVPCRLSSA